MVDGYHVELSQHIRKIATFDHKPQCGGAAKYKVTVAEVPTGRVTCEKCGTLMDSRANQSFFAHARTPGDE